MRPTKPLIAPLCRPIAPLQSLDILRREQHKKSRELLIERRSLAKLLRECADDDSIEPTTEKYKRIADLLDPDGEEGL